jgi:D-alanine-D-alanine ligase
MLMATQTTRHFGKVAVLLGGDSAERDISLQTGRAVLDALLARGVDAHPVDTGEQPLTCLLEEGFDRAFIALHGRGGEDGVIQGALETLGIPYTGSGVLGSALAMDKVRCKRLWQNLGIPTPAFIEIESASDLDAIPEKLGLPVIVKPVHEGSSCGAAKVTEPGGLQSAWEASRQLDDRVMAECWITGGEYTAAILGETVLPMIRLETPREFYDYEAKYLAEDTQYLCPCGLPEARERELGEMMLQAFRAIDASGWGRADFMLDEAGQPWLIEVNTIPGMTSHSLVPMAARQAGMDFNDLVVRILETSLSRDGLRQEVRS